MSGVSGRNSGGAGAGGLLGVKFLYKKDVGKICYKEIKSYLCVVRLNVRLNGQVVELKFMVCRSV